MAYSKAVLLALLFAVTLVSARQLAHSSTSQQTESVDESKYGHYDHGHGHGGYGHGGGGYGHGGHGGHYPPNAEKNEAVEPQGYGHGGYGHGGGGSGYGHGGGGHGGYGYGGGGHRGDGHGGGHYPPKVTMTTTEEKH